MLHGAISIKNSAVNEECDCSRRRAIQKERERDREREREGERARESEERSDRLIRAEGSQDVERHSVSPLSP